jgi:uncharacterized membrane protein YkvA (DUF1232 family)
MQFEISRLPEASRQPDERAFWRKLARVLASIAFAEDLVASWYCAKDPATPVKVRALLWGAAAYFILPTDLVPDMLAGLGFSDDAAVIATVISLLSRHLKPEHRAAAVERLDLLRQRL